jgi:hypothetical protein
VTQIQFYMNQFCSLFNEKGGECWWWSYSLTELLKSISDGYLDDITYKEYLVMTLERNSQSHDDVLVLGGHRDICIFLLASWLHRPHLENNPWTTLEEVICAVLSLLEGKE